jgi:hypothetical protein
VSVIFVIVGFGLLVRSMFVFDNLLRHQIRTDRASWERDGEPLGCLFNPLGSFTILNKNARARIIHQWLRSTPDWAKADARALQMLSWYRVCAVGGLIAFALGGLELLYYWNA